MQFSLMNEDNVQSASMLALFEFGHSISYHRDDSEFQRVFVYSYGNHKVTIK